MAAARLRLLEEARHGIFVRHVHFDRQRRRRRQDLSSSTAAADLAALRAAMTMRAPAVASPSAMP